jgi:AraC-like DNA-binding protein
MIGTHGSIEVTGIDGTRRNAKILRMDNPARHLYVEQRRRLRRVVEFMGQAVKDHAAGPHVTLRRLAEIACWSPEHFDRVYRSVAAEPPMATLRRLRLKQAARWLERGMRLGEVAELSGYASTQAFGRAFRRQFGSHPSQWAARQKAAPPEDKPAFEVVRLDHEVPCHTLRMSGAPQDVSALFDQTLLRLQRSGSPRAQWQVFGATPGDSELGQWSRAGGLLELTSVVLGPPLSQAPRGMDRGSVKAGNYARIPALAVGRANWSDLLHEGGWQRRDGESLRHYDTDPAFTAPQERREWIYVPVAGRSGRA